MADPLMLRSIVPNLVTNAIKYTPEDGSVWLNAEREGQMACILIADTGVGMTDEMQAQLFSNATRGSLSGTNNEQGSGLGMLLVSDFVAQHGGVIDVESTLGAGTSIRFTIPATEMELKE